jgi:thiamine biosynthesis lipoprotein
MRQIERIVSIEALPWGYRGQFYAMGSPCELLSEAKSAEDAEKFTAIVAAEAWRIEDKLSRYIRGNIIHQINSANGQAIEVDDETAALLDFAATLYSLSDCAFDITSGVLRRVWTFDGSDNIPSNAEVEALLDRVGWNKVKWQSPLLQMPNDMEVDLGGIGKEYAVDKACDLLKSKGTPACLVNFGGDLAVTGQPKTRGAWAVGIEAANPDESAMIIELRQGALATSGDARRFLEKDGIRYGHVIDPRTGWPVDQAATSITVAAETCTQAGMLSTLAMLKGPQAEDFLKKQSEQYWCRR